MNTTTATMPAPAPTPDAAPPAPGHLAPDDLAHLLSVFNETTGKLQRTHDHLVREVARLTRDLGEANEQLERSRRLAALGEMAAGIAHEVRNPLGGVRLYARMLEHDLADRPGMRDLASKIASGAGAIDRIVGDVLTFAREIKPRRERLDADALFDAALESCRHDGVPGWRDAAVLRDDAGVAVDADPSLMTQALANIIRNAFEVMHDHGRSGRGARLVLSARRGRGGGAELSVADHGPGVPPGVLERVFNPFFTTRAAGTGLGLSIVHRIVEAHGGRINVRNNPPAPDGPGGATFTLFIPDASSPAQDGPARGVVTTVRTHAPRTEAA
ncbi:MAG: hypothetical protein HRU70_12635 [Phycisphaeraceae bacterium]|nr:MAG: hypothetical protein HRU70_12635 [Phycisphaeraceae bacterium]